MIIAASILVVTSAQALYEDNGTVFDEREAKNYVTHKCYYDNMWCALAISKDGAFGTSTTNNPKGARYNAVSQCKIIARKPETCEIVDVNANSEFIKTFNSQSIQTTAAPVKPANTLRERLLELRSLVDEGLINNDDYEKAKQRILDDF